MEEMASEVVVSLKDEEDLRATGIYEMESEVVASLKDPLTMELSLKDPPV